MTTLRKPASRLGLAAALAAVCVAATSCLPPGVVAQTGSRGAAVERIQRALGLPVDGVYGASTTSAVSRWQAGHRLAATGTVDQATMKVLFPFPLTTRVIGTSVRGLPITMDVVGDPHAPRKVLVLGCIHGNECAGVPMLTALTSVAPPKGVAYFLIQYPNPDGSIAHTRQNARLVDLNRNFPGWRAAGYPGSVYYPGTGPLSEPESRAIYNVINYFKPTVFLTYHQALNIIDFNGGNYLAGLGYAQRSGEPYQQTTRYAGSATTWAHAAYPAMTILTVELPPRAYSWQITAHFRAAQWIATHA